jgi:hypothetical protein
VPATLSVDGVVVGEVSAITFSGPNFITYATNFIAPGSYSFVYPDRSGVGVWIPTTATVTTQYVWDEEGRRYEVPPVAPAPPAAFFGPGTPWVDAQALALDALEHLAIETADRERYITQTALIDEADKKAEALLRCLLREDQRAQYERERAFEVVTSKGGGTRRYRLRKGRTGNVFLVNEHGREVESYCIHPNENVPDADNLIAQKLLLEADETEFLRIANCTVLRLGSVGPAYPRVEAAA